MATVTTQPLRTLPELLEAIKVQLAYNQAMMSVPRDHRSVTLRELQRRLFALKDERDDRFPNWYATAVELGYEK